MGIRAGFPKHMCQYWEKGVPSKLYLCLFAVYLLVFLIVLFRRKCFFFLNPISPYKSNKL